MDALLAEAQASLADGTFDAEAFLGTAGMLWGDAKAQLEAATLAAESQQKNAEGVKDQFLRLQADFENFRKRQAAETEKLGQRNTARVVKEFIGLVDNFELARQQIKCETEGEEKINNSYQGLYRQMVEIFRTLGVEAVPTVGVQFDPSVHEAVMQEPHDGVTDGEVVKEFRKGFSINGELIRPAMVVVCTNDAMPYVPPAEPEAESGAAEGSEGASEGASE